MLITCTMIIFYFRLIMPFVKSVLELGGVLILLSILTTVLISITSRSWFGFITFLIYITGLLVLFGYMLVLSPNSIIKISRIYIVIFFIIIILIFPSSKLKVNLKLNFESVNIINIYEAFNMLIYLLIICLLFVRLILAVYLSYKVPKPLRSYLIS